MQFYEADIRAWAKTATPGKRFRATYDAGRVIGKGVLRATGKYEKMTKVRFVLEPTQNAGKPYFLLTVFPEP